MELQEILSKCDHTLLKQTATFSDIQSICDDGIKYNTASVCIPPCYVKDAKNYVGDKLSICTVIGFPNGYNTTKVKVYETEQAILDGADEIDMVINIGQLKAHNYDYVLNEIVEINKVCKKYGKLLKVIIETCLLTDDEKIKMCNLVTEAKADYIKTSTGFSTAGATKEDVTLFAQHIGKDVKIKAAGGISNLADAEEFIKLGASRLGTSRIVKIAKETKRQLNN